MFACFSIYLPSHPHTNSGSDRGGRSQQGAGLYENASPSGEPFWLYPLLSQGNDDHMLSTGSVELRRSMKLGAAVVLGIVSKREGLKNKTSGWLTSSMTPMSVAHHSASSGMVKVEVLGVLGAFVSWSAEVDTQRERGPN